METLERWLKRLGVVGGLVLMAAYVTFCAWTLPSKEMIRVTGTETRRSEIVERAEEGGVRARDVRYIMAEAEDGSPRMYRNEDTGWGWPPYFKFDSGNLAARAQSLATNPERPLVAASYYGFRIPMFSAFPNMLEIQMSETGERPLPWLTIFVVLVHLVLIVVLAGAYRGFKRADEEAQAS